MSVPQHFKYGTWNPEEQLRDTRTVGVYKSCLAWLSACWNPLSLPTCFPPVSASVIPEKTLHAQLRVCYDTVHSLYGIITEFFSK